MFQKSLLTIMIAGAASIALPAYAQSEGPGRQEVTVQAFGSFVSTTTQNGIDNTATNSGGVLASRLKNASSDTSVVDTDFE